MLMSLALVQPAAAAAPALQAVHRWAFPTVALTGERYHYGPDHHGVSAGVRWHMAVLWHRRYLAAQRLRNSAATVPAWFAGDLTCIGIHEEGGQNSVAGMYGFVYPPSAYVAWWQRYGDSWLGWPRPAQQLVAWTLYQRYGWSPWSTAVGCGL